MSKHAISAVTAAFVLVLAPAALAQPTEPLPSGPAEPVPALLPSSDPLAAPPAEPAPSTPAPPPAAVIEEPRQPPPEEQPEEMSEGRRIVVAWNTGFQWGLSPGVVFSGGKTAFFLGLRLGYGFDTGKVIVVPGLRLSGFFTDPNVYVGMPVMKLVYPIDRFAPFVEGGGGVGHVAGYDVNRVTSVDPVTGLALFFGGGFMVHFTARFGLGVEATYQTITGTNFSGVGVGPLLALAF